MNPKTDPPMTQKYIPDIKPQSRSDSLTEQSQSDLLAQSFAKATPDERERLGRIIDLLPCYVVLVDDCFQVKYHNKAFSDFFGQPENRTCYSLLRGQESECTYCAPMEAITSGSSSVMEWVHQGSNHAFRVYSYPFKDMDGEKLVLKVGFNITANVRVQQALDLSEQSYRVITDNLSIGIALLSPDLGLRGGNSRLSLWFGNQITKTQRICEILRCPTYTPELSASGQFCEDCLFQVAAKDNVTKETEFAVVLQDGKEHHMRVVACPVAPRRGYVRAVIMMLEDITKRQQISQQLHRAKRLEAVSTLAGGIAHEINQPLSALHLYAGGLQMLLEKNEDIPATTTKERLNLIMHEADRIRGIIAHMRALVMRGGDVPLEPVPLAETIDSVLNIMGRQLADRGLQVLKDIPSGLPLVQSNAIQLEQVLVNLLANAMHALDGDASASLSEERNEKKPGDILIRASLADSGRKVLLEVADSGPGLPDGSEHIFDPFYTTRAQSQGMGLGLSIVHGFTTLWGGQVYAVPHHKDMGGAGFFVEMLVADKGEASKADGD